MQDDLQFNDKFVELVQERPCLYDFHMPEYSNKITQDAAWLEIANIVEESVADCKERWKNLRGCYTRHLKKIALAGSSKFVRPYYLAENMQFLNRFTKSRTPKYKTLQRQSTASRLRDTAPESDEDKSNDADMMTNTRNTHQNTKTIFKKNKLNATATESFKTKQKITSNNETQGSLSQLKNHPDLAFFYSLLPDMKDMSRDQKRRFKMGVLNLAGEILQENEIKFISATNQFSDSSDAAESPADNEIKFIQV